jgi:hypothetical protein
MLSHGPSPPSGRHAIAVGEQRNDGGRCEHGRVNIYVWMLLTAVAFVLVLWCVLIVVWVVLLRRMAQSGIRSWDELEAEDADLRAYR